MTVNELIKSDSTYLTCAQVAELLGSKNPQQLRIQARENPDSLGFPVCVFGKRVKIPRIPFIKFLLGDEEASIAISILTVNEQKR